MKTTLPSKLLMLSLAVAMTTTSELSAAPNSIGLQVNHNGISTVFATAAKNDPPVKITPHVMKREMVVKAKKNKSKQKQLDFFVFDTGGQMVQHHKMKPKDSYRLAGLKRGQYIYRVFSGDEEAANGKFEIR